ncbi:hypothetical protein [Vibrio barjaei]|uniref:hypothetical protein n=1 Tax=Vibrio barjaei TaxID=1676683 RepID=UPI002283E904|nr:hypothetical protein [Vibrio barjaei]MCY9872297.1 hypothetical protein [Vibrio barjaei]
MISYEQLDSFRKIYAKVVKSKDYEAIARCSEQLSLLISSEGIFDESYPEGKRLLFKQLKSIQSQAIKVVDAEKRRLGDAMKTNDNNKKSVQEYLRVQESQ